MFICSGHEFSQRAIKRFSHTPALHRFSIIWDLYSSLKYLRVVSTGFALVCPRPQSDESFMTIASFSRVSISLSVPLPFVILFNI